VVDSARAAVESWVFVTGVEMDDEDDEDELTALACPQSWKKTKQREIGILASMLMM
jgi:hypothetical protein